MCLMHRHEFLDCLDFDDNKIAYDHIQSKPRLNLGITIAYRDGDLRPDIDPSRTKFIGKALFVDGFYQAGTQRAMDGKCRINDLVCNIVMRVRRL